jgi:hypothetical protein
MSDAIYSQVGNVVTVSGGFNALPLGVIGQICSFFATLPIASALNGGCYGTLAANSQVGQCGSIITGGTNGANFTWDPSIAMYTSFTYTYQYLID